MQRKTRWKETLKEIALALAAVLWLATGLFAAAPSKLPPAGYDQTRDPAADLQAAVVKAKQEDKRILLEVGGEWCIYCRILNKVIHDDPRLTRRLDEGFIVIKVHFSPEVPNEDFLSRYPEIQSFPHLFLLESDGSLLLSQTPDAFMKGDKYVPELILAFLEKWAPRARPAAQGR
jgi:thioredoxin-related protein